MIIIFLPLMVLKLFVKSLIEISINGFYLGQPENPTKRLFQLGCIEAVFASEPLEQSDLSLLPVLP